jgi:hypothetical protein
MAFTPPSDSSLHTLSVSELAEHCLSEVNTYLNITIKRESGALLHFS